MLLLKQKSGCRNVFFFQDYCEFILYLRNVERLKAFAFLWKIIKTIVLFEDKETCKNIFL